MSTKSDNLFNNQLNCNIFEVDTVKSSSLKIRQISLIAKIFIEFVVPNPINIKSKAMPN